MATSNKHGIVNEGPAYLPPIDEQPNLRTIDLRKFNMEAALYVNEWDEVVAYYDVAQGVLREQELMHMAVMVLGLDWCVLTEQPLCNN